jgi:DNA polymerase-3 subunit epsilon
MAIQPKPLLLQALTLAIVDVETTGGSAATDRIIEIGIQRVESGRVARTYSTLVDPECSIPPMITQLTGIRDADVAGAPTFSQICGEVRSLLQGCVFVAHNVRFDYGFVRSEFFRLQELFSAPCLCTVRLSRALYPRDRHHSLDRLIERHQLACARRHRALDDAKVVWAFLQDVAGSGQAEHLAAVLQRFLAPPRLPPRLAAASIDRLPGGPGVYVFYDEAERPLYVGCGTDIRERVLSHFTGEGRAGREPYLRRHAARVEAHPVFGELGMRLREADLIARLDPLCQRPMRREEPRARRGLRPWPFPGPVLIEERGIGQTAGHAFVVDQWRLLRAITYEDEGQSAWPETDGRLDAEHYRIFTRYLLRRPRGVKLISEEAAEQLMVAQG